MKLDFWGILTGSEKKSSREIAQEIVKLEIEIERLKGIAHGAEKESIKLRKSKIAGAKVVESELEKRNKEMLDAKLNSEAAEEALEELRTKLNQSIEAEREEESHELENLQADLKDQEPQARLELIKAAAVLHVQRIAFSGGIVDRVYSFANTTEGARFFEEEVDRLIKLNAGKQTHFQRLSEHKKRLAKLNSETPEVIANNILEEIRDELARA